MHDYDDPECLRILGHVRRAMRPDARVLVLEAPLPSDDSPGPGRWLDLQVMVLCGGRERTVEEYAAPVRASAGLRLSRTIPTQHPGNDRGRSGRGRRATCVMRSQAEARVIRRRHVIYVEGYDPQGAKGYYRLVRARAGRASSRSGRSRALLGPARAGIAGLRALGRRGGGTRTGRSAPATTSCGRSTSSAPTWPSRCGGSFRARWPGRSTTRQRRALARDARLGLVRLGAALLPDHAAALARRCRSRAAGSWRLRPCPLCSRRRSLAISSVRASRVALAHLRRCCAGSRSAGS